MPIFKSFRVPQAPTNPHPVEAPAESAPVFDVNRLFEGPIDSDAPKGNAGVALDEKLRQAYFWVVNYAVISPHYDIEYNADGARAASQSIRFGEAGSVLNLPSGQSYSSYILLPLLTFATRRRCLLVGAPGRGKTATAILMGVLAGYGLRDVKRSIQHGQPQMTIADLLGNPLPADLVAAKTMDAITISWRKWLGMRVKIIDEYNRIPTRTQSALLTVMGDGYAEILDQIYECPESAWYLTANDDAGGGTYQVIEALKDRIDVVVKALPFNMRFLGDLLARIEGQVRPEEVVPEEIVFTEAEGDRLVREILKVELSPPLRRRLEFFASQFEFLDAAGEQIEYKSKDTARLAGSDVGQMIAQDTGHDLVRDLGSQTRNGLSVRALMTALVYIKAVAYFRGNRHVEIEDIRQMLPFVMHDKLGQNPDSPFFEAPGNAVLRNDKISWIRRLFDLSCAEYDRLDLDRTDPVAAMLAEFARGLEGLREREVRARVTAIERLLGDWSRGRKLYGHLQDDVLTLKYLHQRYTNYLRWLQSGG